MKKLTKWLNKPVTWGGYAKMVGICYVIGILFAGITWIVYYQPKWYRKFKNLKSKLFRRKDKRCNVQ